MSFSNESASRTSPPRKPPKPPPPPPITVRSVWSYNLDFEFSILRSIIDRYPLISMDTEFPGVIFRRSAEDREPSALYRNLKQNVDFLNLIQIGLTLSDERGNLPDLGTGVHFIWELNFKDFDVERDPHAPDSVQLLRQQGMDFQRNREFGIELVRFGELMISSGLILNDSVTWVTFHGPYDFGYMVKCLTRQPLPRELPEFVSVVRLLFGDRVYDVKHVMRYHAHLHGGLDRVGRLLGLDRMVGKCHQAGSDSLLTLQVFLKVKELYFGDRDGNDCMELENYANVLYGLDFSA